MKLRILPRAVDCRLPQIIPCIANPSEAKNNACPVALSPAGVGELPRRGHEVLAQAGAGEGSSIADADFKAAGAQLISSAEQVWAAAALLLKVKEPMPDESQYQRRG